VRKLIAVGLAAGLGAASLVAWTKRDGAALPASATPSTPLRCAFRAEEAAAFSFTSTGVLEDHEDKDHVEGVLSWVVVEPGEGRRPALLRAALSSVALEQQLSEEKVSVDELANSPFFVRVDASCRFGALGTSPRWRAATRHLVESLFQGGELVLPEDGASQRWQAEQQDGVGNYTGRYHATAEAGGQVVVRTKPTYHLDTTAKQMGIRVQVLGGRMQGRFEPAQPAWFQEVTGRELVRLHIDGQAPQGFIHTYSVKRDDARFRPVSDSLALVDADFTGDAAASASDEPAASEPTRTAVDYAAARARFHGFLLEAGKQGIYAASRYLAAWLRANPQQSERLLTDLKSGAIAEQAHSALFLAFELAGTKESRQALSEALGDPGLSELNRARAATALADHGEPTREAADLLLTRARSSDSSLVASTSLLGLGRLAARTGDAEPLKGNIRRSLEAELTLAHSDEATITAIDALGNSRDGAFAPALGERLGSGSAGVRAHAAEALGRLPSEVARPRLIAQFRTEESPRVVTAIARSLGAMPGNLTDAELTLVAGRLSSSTSVDERAALIDWLGGARDQAAARQVLAAHFAAESSTKLQQRIGTFVATADLRTASR
jgi:HEAT repeat protein